jgi:hypothetical protein
MSKKKTLSFGLLVFCYLVVLCAFASAAFPDHHSNANALDEVNLPSRSFVPLYSLLG